MSRLNFIPGLLLASTLANPAEAGAPQAHDLMGGEQFETTVGAYLESTKDGIATLHISQMPVDFRASLLDTHEGGNTLVRPLPNGDWLFQLGCMKDGAIENDNFTIPQELLLTSSARNPVSVTLQFAMHTGFGGECISLADGVQVQAFVGSNGRVASH